MWIPTWPTDGSAREVTLVVVLATAAVLLHHYGPWRGRVQPTRWAGLLLFGLPSVLIRPEAMAVPRLVPAAVFLGIIAAVILPVIVVAARQPRYWQDYPDDRRESWDLRGELGNAATWALYLVGYELFFRGLVLLTLTRAYGPWPALAITTSIYAVAHLPKPAGEGAGAFPMGFVFGIVTLASGSVWPAVLGHLAIAVTSDSAAIRWRRRAASRTAL